MGVSECPEYGQVNLEMLTALGMGQTQKSQRTLMQCRTPTPLKFHTLHSSNIYPGRGQNSDKHFPDSSKQKLSYLKRCVELPVKTELTIQPWPSSSVVRPSSQYAKIVGLIPSQGTYKKQPVNTPIRGTTNRCFSLFLSHFSPKINK